MGPSLSSRGRAARSPSSSPVPGPLRSSLSSTSRRRVLASVRGQRGAAYMMRSDRGMVSLSSGRVIRRQRRLLPNLRLHQFHRPSGGTSGELGLIRGVAHYSLFSYMNSYKMSRVICSIYIKQTMLCLMPTYEQRRSVLPWHDGPPAWPCKLSISEARRERRRRRD